METKQNDMQKQRLEQQIRFIIEADKVKNILSIGNQTGEGWFLTAEMIEFIENDKNENIKFSSKDNEYILDRSKMTYLYNEEYGK